MKGRKLLDVDPSTLNDAELDMQIGALAEELEKIDSEIVGLERVRSGLESRRAELLSQDTVAKTQRGNRGNGRGNR